MNELTIPYVSGATCYAVAIDSGGRWWNTTSSAFETYQDADWSSYAIAATEEGTSGNYLASFPAAPPGLYSIQAYARAGDNPAVSDSSSGPIALLSQFAWNGSIEVSVPAPTGGGSGAPGAASPWTPLGIVYCTDEDVALRACGDFQALCPPSQLLASGTDGAFLAGAPWFLTSASVDFAASGIARGHVVQITGPRPFVMGQGPLFGVDSANASGVVLRRLGQATGVGMPPGPAAGMTGISFAIATVGPQIESCSYDANQQFGIDPAIAVKSPSWLYDQRNLQQWVVLSVLRRLYGTEARTKEGDFPQKLKQVGQDLDDLKDRLVIRWGPAGESEEARTSFGARYRR
jgi:hypothetical protein